MLPNEGRTIVGELRVLQMVLTWAARLLSLALLLMILVLVVAHALPGGGGLPTVLDIKLVGLVLAVVGLATGILRPLVGGLLALAGVAIFTGVDYLHWPGGPVFPVLLLTAGLLIASGVLRIVCPTPGGTGSAIEPSDSHPGQ